MSAPWDLVRANFGKGLKRLSVPGTDRNGFQRIEIDFDDGTTIRVKERGIEAAWLAVWRHRYPEQAP